MKLHEETISKTDAFSGRIFNVHVDDVRLENGVDTKREVVSHPGGVCVAALDKENNLYFVRQFRYPYKKIMLELPAGKLEKGEDPFEAMKREQREETGTISDNYISLGEMYPTPGYCDEIIRLWACRVTSTCQMDLDEDEFVEVEKINIDKAVEMVMSNQIADAKTQVGILKTATLLHTGKI